MVASYDIVYLALSPGRVDFRHLAGRVLVAFGAVTAAGGSNWQDILPRALRPLRSTAVHRP